MIPTEKTINQKIETLRGKVKIMLMLGCRGIEDLETLEYNLDEHIKAIFEIELEND
jgi:hypothetical protein